MSEHRTPEVHTALAFLRAWAEHDMTTAIALLDESVTFDSPAHHLTGRDQMAAVIGEFAQIVTGINITVVTDHGPDVVVVYAMDTKPFGTIRVAEHFVIQDRRITADTLIFDTAPMTPPQP